MVDDTGRSFDPMDDDWDADLDDDFLFHLVQGGDLMRSGRMVEAKEHLEKAFSLKPDNARGQNMLGLVYFKLGLYQRAIDIGQALIKRYPEDVTLRVNLAMIQLKAGELEQAEDSLKAALDLDSDHVNAHRYLGLVTARMGRLDEARRHFENAGVQDVERLLAEAQEAMSASALPDSQPPKQEALEQVEAEGYRDLERAHEQVMEVSDPGEPREMDMGDSAFSDHGPVEMGEDLSADGQEEPAKLASIPPPAADGHEKALSELEEPAARQDAEAAAPQGVEAAAMAMAEAAVMAASEGPALSRGPVVEAPVEAPAEAPVEAPVEAVTVPEAPPAAALQASWQIDGDRLLLAPSEGAYMRAGEVLWVKGSMSFQQVFKRFAGKETRHAFDRGDQAMVLAKGEGQVQLASAEEEPLFLVENGQESLYLVEQNVFAFEQTDAWENGRLPAVKGADLAIFHLFAPVRIVLRLQRGFQRHALEGDQLFRMHVRQLVGWRGELVPRLYEPEHPLPGGLWIELSGQGEVWCLK